MLVSAASSTHRNLLEPIGRFLYNYALMPCVHGGRYASECIAAGSRASYDNVLVPAAHGIRKGAEFIYANAIVPLGSGLLWILENLSDALSLGANAMYTYVL